MPSFSFVHCGDAHLGAPFRDLGEAASGFSDLVRDAPMRAFGRLVSTAIERRVAAVLIAGDLFHAADRNLRTQIHLRDQLRRLDAAGIRTFIAAGNHDPLGGRVSSIAYPASVHWFGRDVEAVSLEVDGAVAAHVYGISYAQSEVRENLSARFPAAPLGPFSIALLHANVGDRAGHGAYAPCSLRDLQSKRFDYWALGHVHARETLHAERPVVHYPGNPQGLHRKETGARGATLVEVAANGAMSLSPIWTDTVRWHRVRTRIDELETMDALLGEFATQAGRLAGEGADRLHIVNWTLAGQGPLHEELRRPEAVPDLLEALRSEHADPPAPGCVWVENVRLATRPLRNIEALREQHDFLGDLLRLAAEARHSPPSPPPRELGDGASLKQEPPISVALRQALRDLLDDTRLRAALDCDPWEIVDWSAVLHEAEIRAIEGLAEEDAQP